MKLKIRKNKYALIFYLPLSFIKSKLLFKLVMNKIDSKDIEISRDILLQLYKEIKKYTKENGHFKIVEVKHEGCEIDIKI